MKLIVTGLVISSVVSVTGSLLVILTPICFSSMRQKLFMRVIAYISVGDLLGNFPYMLPYRPSARSWWCDAQAILNFAGYPMEWLWTVVLVYLLYQLAAEGKPVSLSWPTHVICWLMPLLFALLIPSFGSYQSNDEPGEVCLANETVLSLIYHDATYYGMFFGSLLTMGWLYFLIHRLESVATEENFLRKGPFLVAKRALVWYPTILLIFWIPHAFTSFYVGNLPDQLYSFLLVWKVLHGLATSIIFFAQSQESRRLWYIAIILPIISMVWRTDDTSSSASKRNMSEDGENIIDIDDIFDPDHAFFKRALSTASASSKRNSDMSDLIRLSSSTQSPPIGVVHHNNPLHSSKNVESLDL